MISEKNIIYSRMDGDHRPKKFIQEVVSSPKFAKGAFTAQAIHHGMTPKQFMKEVLSKPEEFSERTRKRAQFMENIQPK